MVGKTVEQECLVQAFLNPRSFEGQLGFAFALNIQTVLFTAFFHTLLKHPSERYRWGRVGRMA